MLLICKYFSQYSIVFFSLDVCIFKTKKQKNFDFLSRLNKMADKAKLQSEKLVKMLLKFLTNQILFEQWQFLFIHQCIYFCLIRRNWFCDNKILNKFHIKLIHIVSVFPKMFHCHVVVHYFPWYVIVCGPDC